MALKWRDIKHAPRDRQIAVAYVTNGGFVNIANAQWGKYKGVEGWVCNAGHGPLIWDEPDLKWIELPEMKL